MRTRSKALALASLLLACTCVPAQTATDSEALLSNVRQLTFEGRRSGEGYFSADGRQMIFQSEREPGNPFYQIYLMDLENGDIQRVSPGSGKTTCGWIHPSSGRVLFASSHGDPEAREKQRQELEKRAAGQGSRYSWSFDEHYEIYQADRDGDNLRRLTDARGYDAEGSWSPDGSRILFASNRQAYERELSAEERERLEQDPSYFMDLYRMDADGGNLRRLTDTPGYDGGPFYSADGSRIVWRRFSEDGHQAEIWTMDADGSGQRPITRLEVLSWAPYFHPSGDYIIFANNLQGYRNFELYLVDSAGAREPVRVSFSEGFDGLPVFSPDGRRLSWSSARTADKKPQIFLADWDDAGARKVLGLGPASRRQPRPAAAPAGDLTSAPISEDDLRLHLDYLASEQLGGRLTGSEGEGLAARYVADAFHRAGLQPAGDMGGWEQYFAFTREISLADGNRLTLTSGAGTEELEVDRDWLPLVFSGSGSVAAASVVFAGYGIMAPADGTAAEYDSYAGLEVEGKWVMVLRYLPDEIAAERRQYLSNYAGLRYKAMLARDRGARGLIVVSGPRSGVKAQLVPLESEAGAGGGSLPAFAISDAAARRLLQAADRELASLQLELDQGGPVAGFELTGTTLAAEIRLQRIQGVGRNVLGRLRAGETPSEQLVVIGAHLDHIGSGKGMDSLADGADAGRVHPGADDNASGVAALLEIAQHLAERQRASRLQLKRDILFAAWSGEEMGRLGSARFVASFAAKGDGTDGLLPQVSAYLNMDMVGRLDQHLYLQGAGSSSVWSGEIERRNLPVGLSIRTQDDSYLPTDATSFYLAGIPILSAFTGAHSDYNTPRDTAERINYPGLEKISRLMALITRSLARREQAPDYMETEKPSAGASRANLRAYLGTIPDYAASDIGGVKLNGVAKGGPAQQGGLRAGDIIVEIAGRRIENIYDFTYALNALKVGQETEILVLRDGAEKKLAVLPAPRE